MAQQLPGCGDNPAFSNVAIGWLHRHTMPPPTRLCRYFSRHFFGMTQPPIFWLYKAKFLPVCWPDKAKAWQGT